MHVYLITNTINGNKYVGVTQTTIAKRWREHKCAAKSGMERPLYRAMRKYGIEAFTIEAIATADSVESLKTLECRYIADLGTFARNGSGYNLTLGGDGLEKMNAPKGDQSVHAILTEDIVRFIRDPEFAQLSNRLLAQKVQDKFGTLFVLDTLKCARNGKSWSHVDVPPIKTTKGARKPPMSDAQKDDKRAHLATIQRAAILKSADLRRGKRQANARLTEDEVRQIFFAEGSGIEIGARFGVHKKIVYGIKKRTMHTYLTRSL